MSSLDSEEQQIEAIKKWWKENGLAVVMGIVLGVGGLVGWRSWTTYQDNQGAAASILYEQMMGRAAGGDRRGAMDVAEHLAAEYGGTGYADLARLSLARMSYRDGDVAGAVAQLEVVRDEAEIDELKQVAALRLARLRLDEGDLDGAQAVIAGSAAEAFAGVRDEIQGDILAARGDRAGARNAYQRALELTTNDSGRVLLQMKLDDLGGAAPAGDAAS